MSDVLFLYPGLRSWRVWRLLVLFACAVGCSSLPGFDVEKAGHSSLLSMCVPIWPIGLSQEGGTALWEDDCVKEMR